MLLWKSSGSVMGKIKFCISYQIFHRVRLSFSAYIMHLLENWAEHPFERSSVNWEWEDKPIVDFRAFNHHQWTSSHIKNSNRWQKWEFRQYEIEGFEFQNSLEITFLSETIEMMPCPFIEASSNNWGTIFGYFPIMSPRLSQLQNYF